MKKIVVLLMVLGIASVASATLTWSVDSVTIVKGSTAAVTIECDDVVPPAYLVWAGASYSAGHVAKMTGAVETAAAGDDAAAVDKGASAGYPGWWELESVDNGEPFNYATGTHWNVTVSGLELGTYQISCDYYGAEGSDDLLNITVVPEPITIALLGLGGLFLRRRK